ncbi:hypothetical protein AJ80_07003 [Polytolypa hystricis UAMH7299]|uniref:Uncharacterized protein n=1 Tax=Polytolypa hystricis (strain UAMH7299) TaxID=1447883 RepID=A0A2B7XSX2_POLH7|nr:hypothetical protein AJ80_07003 [Polytolypa hystricis UAMH7299]
MHVTTFLRPRCSAIARKYIGASPALTIRCYSVNTLSIKGQVGPQEESGHQGDNVTEGTPAENSPSSSQPQQNPPQGRKTIAEMDQELREKLEAMGSGGGPAALELENGKPVAMKRSVKNNMFRLI